MRIVIHIRGAIRTHDSSVRTVEASSVYICNVRYWQHRITSHKIEILVFLDVTSFSLVVKVCRLGETCCLHLQKRRQPIPPKSWYLSDKIHGVMFQEIVHHAINLSVCSVSVLGTYRLPAIIVAQFCRLMLTFHPISDSSNRNKSLPVRKCVSN
jgi:hypothetical protein